MNKIDESIINSYLYWGYVPTSEDRDFFKITPSKVDNPTIYEAGEILCNTISKLSANGKHNILPISGGLDSRLILCELLKSVHANEITLFTFGISGSYDFEIPKTISKKLGLKLDCIDLHNEVITTNNLVDSISETNEWTYLFDSFYNRLVFRYGPDVNYWSGFMGNNLAGEHLSWYLGDNWAEARKTYVIHERRCNNLSLFSNEYNPFDFIINEPDGSSIPFIDQLDFRHRQPKCILPILRAPTTEYYQYFPLINSSFMNYMMGLPIEYRKGERFYKDLVISRCKLLDDVPVKRTYCLPLKDEFTLKSKAKRLFIKTKNTLLKEDTPMLNYYNYNKALHERNDLQCVVKDNLNDLSCRRIVPWLNIEEIFKKFYLYNAPLHEEIKLLVSLEIYFKYHNI